MKKITDVLVFPLTRRLGTLVTGMLGGIGFMEPTLLARVEAWVTAGAFLAVDLLLAWKNSKTQEVR